MNGVLGIYCMFKIIYTYICLSPLPNLTLNTTDIVCDDCPYRNVVTSFYDGGTSGDYKVCGPPPLLFGKRCIQNVGGLRSDCNVFIIQDMTDKY